MAFFYLFGGITEAQQVVFATLDGTPNMNTTGWNLTGLASVGDTPGDADPNPDEMILMPPVNSSSGGCFYNQALNLGLCNNWTVEFDYRIWGGSGFADGIAFCFLSNPPVGFVTGGGVGIPSAPNGFCVILDQWDNGCGVNPELQIFYGNGVANYNECAAQVRVTGVGIVRQPTYNRMKITYNQGNIDVYINNTWYMGGFYNANLTGFAGFTSSTGGANDQHSVKNVIIYTEQPASNAGTDQIMCSGSTIQIGTASTPGYGYSWTPTSGLNDSTISNPYLTLTNNTAIPQQHTFIVTTDSAGLTCQSNDTIVVTVEPLFADAGTDEIICDGGSAQLNGTGGTQLAWSPGIGLSDSTIGNPIASPLSTTTYVLTSTDLTGNLVTNGDFESGNTGFTSSYTYATNLTPAATYWVGTDASTVHNAFAGFDHTSGAGNFMVVNGSGVAGTDVWCQSISVIPNTDYNFSTWVSSVNAGNPALLQFSINSSVIGLPFPAPPALNTWIQFNATWNSGVNTTAQICIVNQNTTTGGNDFGLDDITFTTMCIATDTMTVFVSTLMSLSDSATDVNCFGGNDGSIDLTVNGGSIPYNFNWSNTDVTEDVSGLTIGTYSVTVQDVNGCTDSLTTTVSEPSAVQDSLTFVDVTCNAGTDGSIDLTVWGGTPGYSFNWSNNSVVEDQVNIPAGSYIVTITDNNGCTSTDNITISEPPAITVSASLIHVTCYNGSDGGAILTVNNATAPVQFQWSNGSTNQTQFGIPAANYGVTVTDDLGCTGTFNFDISQPPLLQVSAIVTDVSCFGELDGFIDVTTSGGTQPYNFNWSHGFGGEDLLNTGAGNYSLTVTDDNLCTATANYIISEPTAILSDIDVLREISCFDYSDGILKVNASGGAGSFTYNWNTVPTSDQTTIFGLETGLYAVTVTDAMSCTIESAQSLQEPDSIWIDLPLEHYIHLGDSVSLFPQLHINSSVQFEWEPDFAITCVDCAFPATYPLHNTEYTLTITDEEGCQAAVTTTVYIIDNTILYVPNAFSPNNDGWNDFYNIHTGFVLDFELRIFNRWGQMVFQSFDHTERWNGEINGKLANPGVYIVDVSVEFINGLHASKTKSLTILR